MWRKSFLYVVVEGKMSSSTSSNEHTPINHVTIDFSTPGSSVDNLISIDFDLDDDINLFVPYVPQHWNRHSRIFLYPIHFPNLIDEMEQVEVVGAFPVEKCWSGSRCPAGRTTWGVGWKCWCISCENEDVIIINFDDESDDDMSDVRCGGYVEDAIS